jgi:hypothetical protein
LSAQHAFHLFAAVDLRHGLSTLSLLKLFEVRRCEQMPVRGVSIEGNFFAMAESAQLTFADLQQSRGGNDAV